MSGFQITMRPRRLTPEQEAALQAKIDADMARQKEVVARIRARVPAAQPTRRA